MRAKRTGPRLLCGTLCHLLWEHQLLEEDKVSGSENQCAKACTELPGASLISLLWLFRIFVSWESGPLTLAYITKQHDDKPNQSP